MKHTSLDLHATPPRLMRLSARSRFLVMPKLLTRL